MKFKSLNLICIRLNLERKSYISHKKREFYYVLGRSVFNNVDKSSDSKSPISLTNCFRQPGIFWVKLNKSRIEFNFQKKDRFSRFSREEWVTFLFLDSKKVAKNPKSVRIAAHWNGACAVWETLVGAHRKAARNDPFRHCIGSSRRENLL